MAECAAPWTARELALDGDEIRKAGPSVSRTDTDWTRHIRNPSGHRVQSRHDRLHCSQRGSGRVIIWTTVPCGYGLVAVGNPAGLTAPSGVWLASSLLWEFDHA